MSVVHPPGLQKDWACVLNPTGMPYFYNTTTKVTSWKLPSSHPAALPQLSTQRTQLIQILEQLQQQDTTIPTPATMSTGLRNSNAHPLHVARTKLHSSTISDEEYAHIVKTHKLMASEQQTVIVEGELMKMGKRTGRFVRRWFVLHSDQELFSCRSDNPVDRYQPSSIIDLAKYICMPTAVGSHLHCIELTEIHGDSKTVLAAPSVDVQVLWLEAMLQTKTQTYGMGRLSVVKANAALKSIKRKARMPSM